jgi:hypothetical protein
VRILFCGDCFPASHSLLKERLRAGEDEITVCNGANLREALSKADVVIPMMTILDEARMEAGTFRLVQQWGSGLEGVDLHAARSRSIWVANVPASGNNADSVAEHALLLTLALLRQLPAAQANVRTGALGAPLGRMLAGRTVCLYGLGATARALAHRLRPMGVRLIGITRDPAVPKAAEFALHECFSSSEQPCLERTCSYFVSVWRTGRAGWLTPVRSRRCLSARFLSMPRAADSLTIARFMTRSRAAISAAPDSMSIGRNHFLQMTPC